MKNLSRVIKKLDILEQNEETENELLIGYFTLLLKLTKSKIPLDAQEDILGEKIDKYVTFIINECLFNLEEPNKIKFKSPLLRSLGYQLLEEF